MYSGVNIEGNGIVKDVSKSILDLYHTKLSAQRLAPDAAITVLRVDQVSSILLSISFGDPQVALFTDYHVKASRWPKTTEGNG